MLVLRLLSDRTWDIEMVPGNDTTCLKKVKAAQTVEVLLRDTRKTTDYFYQVLQTAARFGQPVWVNMADVRAMADVRTLTMA